MSKTILVAVDGSNHSKKALQLACELASKLGGILHLLHVAQAPNKDRTLVLGGAAITIHASPQELEKAGRKVMDSAAAIAKEKGCTRVESNLDTSGGDPAKVIVDKAKSIDADMIVMGTRGLSDLSGLMVGSVSHKVNHLAPCTCVTVR